MLEIALDNLAEEGTLLVVGYISEYPHESSARTKVNSVLFICPNTEFVSYVKKSG